jgi:hypothetical protein
VHRSQIIWAPVYQVGTNACHTNNTIRFLGHMAGTVQKQHPPQHTRDSLMASLHLLISCWQASAVIHLL